MNEPVQVVVTVRLAWWAKAYVQSVALFAQMTGMEPDTEKVTAMLIKGLRTKVEMR